MPAAFDFVIRQGDSRPSLTYTMQDSSGNALNLTGASVNFVMRALTSSTPAISASATVVNAAAGQVSFSFTAAQTAVAGRFLASFVATFGDSTVQTSPADGFLEISIEDNLSTPGGAQIVSLAEVKQHLSIPATDKTADERLVEMIRGLTGVIEFFTGPILVRTIDEWHRGGSSMVVLRNRPVVEVLGVEEYRGPVPFPLTIVADPAHSSTYSAMWDASTSTLHRRGPGGSVMQFPEGPQTVHVSYQAGRTTVDANIAEAMKELIRVNFSQTERRLPNPSAASLMAADEEPQRIILGFLVPGRVEQALAPSRRAPGFF